MEKKIKIAFACDHGLTSTFYAQRIARDLSGVDVVSEGIRLTDSSAVELNAPDVVFKLTPTSHAHLKSDVPIRWVEPSELKHYEGFREPNELPHVVVMNAVKNWLFANHY